MITAEDILKQYWGFNSLYPAQKEIIDAVLSGKDVVALLPTGGGKSVCYQIPAILMDGMCLVISPLIALMQDQVAKLKSLGISAAAIHSGMHFIGVKNTLENAVNKGYKLLYVSPERLQTNLFREYLPGMDINLIAVDEAHCISQWGHDFRPDYLKIADVTNLFEEVPVLALTATATEAVRNDIAIQLQLNQPELFVQSFERLNVWYYVRYTENKYNTLLDILKSHRVPSIIYCRSRKQTEILVNYLSQNNIKAIAYHAGMTKQKREDAQEMWMNNTIPIIVATTAFGMGIDKADVGLIVNYDAPEHIEAYYQEAGRGGRNGNQAYSFILYNNTDINRLEDSIGISYPDEKYLQHVYQCIVEYLQIPISAEPDKYYPFDLKDFCEKFKLDAYTASSAVKLLEQEGLWTTTESVFTPPTLFFIINRAELDETIATYPKLAYAVTNLLRLYGSLFQYPTPIRINTIARQLKIKNEEADEILKQLQLLGIADYTTPSHGPQLYFHHYRVDSRQLIIDTKWINILKKRHVDRTNAILNYLSNTEQCRTRLLLQYFGEHKKEDCRHCDICAKKQPSHLTSSISIQTAILQYLASADEIQIHELLRKLAVGSEMEILNTLRAMADEKILTIQGNGIIKRL